MFTFQLSDWKFHCDCSAIIRFSRGLLRGTWPTLCRHRRLAYRPSPHLLASPQAQKQKELARKRASSFLRRNFYTASTVLLYHGVSIRKRLRFYQETEKRRFAFLQLRDGGWAPGPFPHPRLLLIRILPEQPTPELALWYYSVQQNWDFF